MLISWRLEKQLKANKREGAWGLVAINGVRGGIQGEHTIFFLQRSVHSQFIPSHGEQHGGWRREQTAELKRYFDISDKVFGSKTSTVWLFLNCFLSVNSFLFIYVNGYLFSSLETPVFWVLQAEYSRQRCSEVFKGRVT